MCKRREAFFLLILVGLLVLVGTSINQSIVYASHDPVKTYYEYTTIIINGTALNSTDNLNAHDEIYYAVDCGAREEIYEVNVEHTSEQVNESIADITQIFFEDNFKFNATVTTSLEWFNWTANAWVNINSGEVGSTEVAWNKTWTSGFSDVINSTGYMKVRIYTFNQSNTHQLLEDYLHWDVTYVVTPPEWSNAGTNNTVAGQPTLFHVKWTDNVGLGGFIFGTNNTGTWINDTWTPMSGTTDWSNVTKTLNSTGGLVVQWRVWANDTSNNWNDTGILSLTTTQHPVASFTYSPLTPYTDETVTFNASDSYDPDGTLVNYFWDFGDGTNGTGEITTHAYADDGNYTVTLTVTDNDGLSDTTSAEITVLNRPPVATFTESAETVDTGEVINFNATESYDPDGNIVTYFWDFGDGTNATGAMVTHSYADNGTYTVTLTVTDDDGATASTTATKTVLNRPPVAVFTESAETVYTSEVITFNASDSHDLDGTIVTYFWDFGDGTNSTGVTVEHAYTDDGNYTVTLTITDDDGATHSATSIKTILNRPPIAIFTYSPDFPIAGETVTFNASDSYDPDGTVVSYVWNFGDGNITTVFTPIITHVYTLERNYTVTLTLTDNQGLTDTATDTVRVRNYPTAAFTYSPDYPVVGETITFDASSSLSNGGVITSYEWDFGDGNVTTVFTPIITHIYSTFGNYTVTLTVTDSEGLSGSESKTVTVREYPVASFIYSPLTPYTSETVTFNASDSYDPDGTVVSYFWDFGDGTNGTGEITTHTYADDGNYTVTLTVTDNDGLSDIVSADITVLNRLPVAIFTESAETVYTGETVTFNASASYDPDGSIVSFFWDFGDGTNATGMNVSHAYSDDGVYNVTLTVTDNDGASASSTATKTVLNRAPVALFTESATIVLTNEVIYFNASASYDSDGIIVSYFWTFGDGTNATGVTASHAYLDNGTYTVTLTVTDNDGSTVTASAVKTVLNQPPVASFTESGTTVHTGEVITFDASASYDPDGTIVSYFWDFGDGTNATGVAASHAYVDNGTYVVTLTVTDNDGSTTTATATKTVLNRAPVASFTESASIVLTRESITFNASASYDSDGTIVSYTWNFGDGNITTVTVPIITHWYVDNGTYTVTLTVTDNDGATSSASATKTVLNRAPVSVFTESATTVYTREIITFNATASYDIDGSIVSYTWNFGDGNITTVTNPIINHAYSENGTYTVTLTVTDNDGATATAISTKTVLNRPPVASFTENVETAYTGEVIHFNASASYDPDGVIVSYFWDFGDGTNATGVIVEHAYSDVGNYTVTLTVTDDEGATATINATKTIVNRSPVTFFTINTFISLLTFFTGSLPIFLIQAFQAILLSQPGATQLLATGAVDWVLNLCNTFMAAVLDIIEMLLEFSLLVL